MCGARGWLKSILQKHLFVLWGCRIFFLEEVRECMKVLMKRTENSWGIWAEACGMVDC